MPQPVDRPVETGAVRTPVAADLQALIEHEIAQAYRRGYEDRAAGRPLDDSTVQPFDLITAIEDAVSTSTPTFFPGRATAQVHDRHGQAWNFHRADDVVRPDFPSALRIETSKPLDDDAMARLHHLVVYTYAATVNGPLGKPHRDSPYSFVCTADTSASKRTHPMVALGDFERDLADWLLYGSPIRKTDKAGRGTAGTRAVGGLGDRSLRVAVYYDHTRIEPWPSAELPGTEPVVSVEPVDLVTESPRRRAHGGEAA